MVGAELFRQGPRPFAMSLVGLTNWVFTAVVALLFEIIQVSDSCFERIWYQLHIWLNILPCSRLHVNVPYAVVILLYICHV